MSLTQFVALPVIRNRLRQEYALPMIKCANPIKVQMGVSNPGMIGTAFDYLIRFRLHYLNPKAKAQEWAAEIALMRMQCKLESGNCILDKANTIIGKSRKMHKQYLKDGIISDELIECAIWLSQLEPIGRGGKITSNFGSADPAAVSELRAMINLIDPSKFHSATFCALNPRFGKASTEIGGADADIVIDAKLIDIKTVISGTLTEHDFHQLIGYYLLSRIGGINGNKTRLINYLGIYFSRYGELQIFQVPQPIITELSKLTKWFHDEIKKAYKPQLIIPTKKEIEEFVSKYLAIEKRLEQSWLAENPDKGTKDYSKFKDTKRFSFWKASLLSNNEIDFI